MMATKRAMKEDIAILSGKLGVAVPKIVERLNHSDLVAFLADLEAKCAVPTHEFDAAPERADKVVADPAAVPTYFPAADSDPAPVSVIVTPCMAKQANGPAPAVAALRARADLQAIADDMPEEPKLDPSAKYAVCDGRTIYCARTGGAGMRSGERIRSSDFTDSRLRALIKLGAIEEI